MLEIVIKKSARVLELHEGGQLLRSYAVALGSSAAGDKETEGDGKTPEGEFYVFTKNPKSKFHLSLGISYPSREHAARGLRDDLISEAEYEEIENATRDNRMPPQKTALGGEIYIHGGGIESDWTEGCIAVGNDEIEELFEMIPVGTSVTILP